MTTTIVIHRSPNDEHLLRPEPIRSNSDFLHVHRSSIDTTDDDEILTMTTTTTATTTPTLAKQRKRSLLILGSKFRRSLFPQRNLNDFRGSDPSLLDSTSMKETRLGPLPRFDRRAHSSFSSISTVRSSIRRRSTQTLSNRRQVHYLLPQSKWRFVRDNLHRIALMNNEYARAKAIDRSHRWMHLREQIRQEVLEMREISILRKQYEGLTRTTKLKGNFDVKYLPNDQVVHVERDGRVYSIGTRDLVLGRLINAEEIELDAFAQLDARRQFRVKQNLLKRQEGRTRLKKKIAFSFCFCNLFFISLMCVVMFVCMMKTLIDLQSRTFH